MGAFEGGGRFILVLINGLLSLVGIALLIIGCIAKWGEQLTDQYLSEIYKTFQSAASSINTNVDVSNFNIADVLNDVFIALIVLGGFFFLFGIFGCIGATCRVKVALIVYSGVLIFIIVAELVCVILLFTIREKIDSWLKDPMKRQLREKYSGFNGTDTVTLTWNLLMTNLILHVVEVYSIELYQSIENTLNCSVLGFGTRRSCCTGDLASNLFTLYDLLKGHMTPFCLLENQYLGCVFIFKTRTSSSMFGLVKIKCTTVYRNGWV
ncbi:hypothetical protein ACJMK2_026961 [Sinanodonta woodiana]|uniref:Tetraspanin n=1 Tax=Sinanodonta woodiana TaxID=1069815 RepID=A0ABD3XPU0_SINWO